MQTSAATSPGACSIVWGLGSYVSCMQQLFLFQWLCNADKRSHEPRCVLYCVGLYVSCTHACDSFLSPSGCAMQTSAATSPGACLIVWGRMSHACSSFLSPSGCAMQTSAATSPGACSIVWGCMSHALMHAAAFSLPVAVQCRQAQPQVKERVWFGWVVQSCVVT